MFNKIYIEYFELSQIFVLLTKTDGIAYFKNPLN